MQFSRPVLIYVVTILVIGLALAGYCVLMFPIGGDPLHLALFAAFILLMTLSERYGLHLTAGTRVDVGTIPLFASVLIFPPGMAVVVAGLGSLLGHLHERRPAAEHMFNVGLAFTQVAAGSLVLRLFTTNPWSPDGWQAWVGMLAAAAVMYVANTGMIAGVVALTNRIDPIRFWLSSVPLDVVEELVMFALGLLSALVISLYPWALLLLVAPAVAVFVTLDRTLATEARHKQLAEQNAGLASHLSEQAEQLREAYAVLEDAMDAKNQMLQNVSHELRTPLVSIYGYTEALREGLYGDLVDGQAPALDIIHRNTQQMIRLVNDLLALQTLDRSQLQLGHVCLPDLFRQAVATFAQRADAAGINLQVDCDDRIPVLHADGARLEQVIGNLLDNAIKFSPNGGDVLLDARALDSYTLQIMVSDHGIGIPKDELPHIYRRFYQVDGTSTRRFAGQGLGLAIARRIVELHGGGIRAESEEGQGTAFYLTLPVTVPTSAFKLADDD